MRTAIVTGGTRGLGRAISQALHDEGFQVAAVYGNDDAAARAFTEATGIAAWKWNVADFDACRHGVEEVQARLGPVSVLVNNAGITRDAMLHRMSLEQWQSVMDTNLGSMFNMCRSVIETMRAQHYGRIVNISSINGQKGQLGQANYSAAKAGVLGFTKALALENARKNITVNAVTPGYCHTDMVEAIAPEVRDAIIAAIPVGRLCEPDEVARVVAFLAQEQTAFVTGATFAINGGQYMA